MERKAMNWFSRTTSIAGMQVSNWILAIVAVVVLWMIYSAFISLKHTHPILRRTRAAGSSGGEAVGQDHNEAKAIGRFTGRHNAKFTAMSALPPKADIGERNWDVRFVPIADICRVIRSPRRHGRKWRK
jgi:hypothetical protein